MAVNASKRGPDFSKGVLIKTLEKEKSILGHVGDEAVLLAYCEGEYFAVGARCTHYGGPLHDGIIEGETVHCPWHHSCFSLRTGEATKAPALNPIATWETEVHDNRVFVTEKKITAIHPRKGSEGKHIVIIGGGAAGTAAAVMLRGHGYLGKISLVNEEKELPYDRPTLSKEFLEGKAPEKWIPLYTAEFYKENKIDIELGVKAKNINSHRHEVLLSNGKTLIYDKCLIATGGFPTKPSIPGINKDHVYVLRSLLDCRRIIARTSWAFRVAIVGAGFVALETAAALRLRNLEVHVIAPDEMPLMKAVGVHVGSYLKKLHEKHGVKFHLGHEVKEIRDRSVLLDNGRSIDCDFVIIAVGINLNTSLAERAGCRVDDGICVNEYLETTAPDIYAAGDVARWPDPRCKKAIRVEHWEVAERQGQVAALNMMGKKIKFEEVPFFWTRQYDLKIGFVGYSDCYDRMDVLGDLENNNFAVAYYEDQRIAALLTANRDQESLLVEQALLELNDEKVHYVLHEYEQHGSFGL